MQMDLTNVEKLQHLRLCLRDAALETIRLMEISDANYAIALDLLSPVPKVESGK